MKRITKQKPPEKYLAWVKGKKKNEDGSAASWNYDSMEAPVKDAVRQSLIEEQGGLCCYTGLRITSTSSHIEHLKPQALCVNHEDTEYKNLMAAYPKDGCSFGARYKDHWYDSDLFVHPFRHNCEVRLRYRDSGEVVPARPGDKAAEETIKRLNLNDKELIRKRKQAITGWLDADLKKGEVGKIIAQMDSKSNGLYHEFCFVVKQASVRYIKRFQ